MKGLIVGGLLGAVLLSGAAAATTYDVDWTFGDQQVTGTITTDGRTGVHDFISLTVDIWATIDVTLTSPHLYGGAPAPINASNLLQFVFYGLILTPTEISFDFDGPTLFIAQNVVASSIDAPLYGSAWCMTGANFGNRCGGLSLSQAESGFFQLNGRGTFITNLLAPFSGTQVIATAAPVSPPVTTPVPLPAGAVLALTGIAGMLALRRPANR